VLDPSGFLWYCGLTVICCLVSHHSLSVIGVAAHMFGLDLAYWMYSEVFRLRG
jgi:hypothetical protein